MGFSLFYLPVCFIFRYRWIEWMNGWDVSSKLYVYGMYESIIERKTAMLFRDTVLFVLEKRREEERRGDGKQQKTAK